MVLGRILSLVFTGFGRIARFVFSRTGLIFGSLIGLIVLIGGVYLLWNNRLKWKTSSESWQASSTLWQAHATRLEGDTVRLFAESARVQQLNAKLNQQASDATGYAYDYKAKYEQAVAVSDRKVDQLNASQQQVEFWQALVNNRTLPATYIVNRKLITGGDSAVTNAGLKTAGREVEGRVKLALMEKSVATRDAQIAGLKTERDEATTAKNQAVASSLYAEATLTKESRTRRFLGSGRKKAAAAAADSVRKIRETPKADGLPTPDKSDFEISDLERIRNKKSHPN